MELRIFTEPQQGATYDDLAAVAKEAEALGFDAFFRSDHWLHMGSDPGSAPDAGLPGPTDSWVVLAGLARETSRIRLGTLVTSATLLVCCGTDEAELGRRAAAIGRDVAELRENAAAGLPREVVDKLAAYRDAGASRIYLQVLDLSDLDRLRLVASEVMPALG